MRGSIFGVLALGIGIALLPAIFEFDGTDSLGNDIVGVIAEIAPNLLVALFLVTCLALLVGWFVGGDPY